MNKWIIFTAFRQFKSKRREKGDTSTFLSVIGIISGVMTMITVIGIMNGFQGSKIEQRIEILSGHIALEPKVKDASLDSEIFSNFNNIMLFYKSSEFITAASGGRDGEIVGIQVDSVPENIYDEDQGFNKWVKIIDGEFDVKEKNTIIIGQTLANLRYLDIGDSISLLSLKNEEGSSFSPEQVEFRITGVFKTGSMDYNESLVFISNESAVSNFINPSDFVYKIKVPNRKRYKDLYDELYDIEEISDSYNIKSWKEFNTSYFNALKNEKDLMTVLIGLIFLVVGVNIYNSLRRSVYLRFEEISVLKTMGATSSEIKNIFILQSFFIGIIGATIGVIFGLTIVFNINPIFEFLELIINSFFSILNSSSISFYGSQFFYLNKVPVEVYLNESVMVFLSAIFTSIVAAYAASKKISSIRPGEVIRNE